jgi:hypothetical protein
VCARLKATQRYISHRLIIGKMIFNKVGSVNCGGRVSGLETENSHSHMGKHIMPVTPKIQDLHDVSPKLWNFAYYTSPRKQHVQYDPYKKTNHMSSPSRVTSCALYTLTISKSDIMLVLTCGRAKLGEKNVGLRNIIQCKIIRRWSSNLKVFRKM